MTARNLTAGAQAAIAQPHVACFPLIQMDFDAADGGTVRVCGLDFDVEYPQGSDTMYMAIGGLGSMEQINETSESVEGLKLTLSGVPIAKVAEAQQIKYQGRKCTVVMCFLDNGTLYADPATWVGRLDVPVIERGKGTCTITVTAEHSMADWKRKYEQVYNSASQKKINPLDTFFDGIENSKRVEKIVFSKQGRMI